MDPLSQFLISLAGGGLGAGALIYVATKVISGAVTTAVQEISKREQARREADLERQTSHYTLRDERQADAAAAMILATLRFVRALKYVYNPLVFEGEADEGADTISVYSGRAEYLHRFCDAFLDAWHHVRAYLPALASQPVEELDESAGNAYAALNDYLAMTKSKLTQAGFARQIADAHERAFGEKNFQRWDDLAKRVETEMRKFTVPGTTEDKKKKRS